MPSKSKSADMTLKEALKILDKRKGQLDLAAPSHMEEYRAISMIQQEMDRQAEHRDTISKAYEVIMVQRKQAFDAQRERDSAAKGSKKRL